MRPLPFATAIIGMILLLGGGCGGTAETRRPPRGDSRSPATRPRTAPPALSLGEGEVKAFGGLRAILHEGQTGGVVGISSVLQVPRLYGVGALAGLAGEVTLVNGRAYIARPESATTSRTVLSRAPEEEAALLVIASVSRWQPVRVPSSIPFSDLDSSIEQLARVAGVRVRKPFPFLIDGKLQDLRWHVIDGSRLPEGGASHEEHLEAAVAHALAEGPATLVGFFSREHEGVFTHMGSRTHIHCLVESPLSSGHVDHVVVPEGAMIRFPAP